MFEDLVGNEPVKAVLKKFISKGRVPNAMLFAGDDGVGKRQFAIEVARSFVCTDDGSDSACGVCPACQRAVKFTFPKSEKGDDFDQVFYSEHIDVGMVIPFRRNVRIGAIRALEQEANYNPYEAKARFFIVDDAEKMADPAANALLKTLEEPPATSHIFLITSRPDSLLPTIRSRCQMLRFAPVATDEIERYLIEKRAFSSDEARLAARLARGSVGRALGINVEQFRSRRDKMFGALRSAIESGDLAVMLRSAEEINDAKNKEYFEEYLDILQSLIHDVWTLNVTADPTRVVNTDLSSELNGLAAMQRGSTMTEWLAKIDVMRQNLAVNINRKIATDALFVSMAGGKS